MSKNVALIVGAGPGFSAAVAERLAGRGMAVALASRTAKADLATAIGGRAYSFEAGDPAATTALFQTVETDLGPPTFVMYNPSARTRGPLADLDPALVANALTVTAFGGFLVAQEAVRRMVPMGAGKILLTGATASVKGMAQSAAFAMGKFALRGLAQSMARELQPKGIHTLHVVIDGAIRPAGQDDPAGSMLDPGAIADTCLALLDQPRTAWTSEVEVRPFVERF